MRRDHQAWGALGGPFLVSGCCGQRWAAPAITATCKAQGGTADGAGVLPVPESPVLPEGLLARGEDASPCVLCGGAAAAENYALVDVVVAGFTRASGQMASQHTGASRVASQRLSTQRPVWRASWQGRAPPV